MKTKQIVDEAIEIVKFDKVCCANCGVQFMITQEHMKHLRLSSQTFYCPN